MIKKQIGKPDIAEIGTIQSGSPDWNRLIHYGGEAEELYCEMSHSPDKEIVSIKSLELQELLSRMEISFDRIKKGFGSEYSLIK